jgi:hypothetical protein
MHRKFIYSLTLVFLIFLMVLIGCGNDYKELTFTIGEHTYSFEVPSRYEIYSDIDIVSIKEIHSREGLGLTDEQMEFYQKCPDFPEILISAIPKPKSFSSREEVQEFNKEQSEKYGIEFTIIYDYEMLTDFAISQDKKSYVEYNILEKNPIDIVSTKGTQIIFTYYYLDEKQNVESEIVNYEVFFESNNFLWRISLAAPIFLKETASLDFEHITDIFRIFD